MPNIIKGALSKLAKPIDPLLTMRSIGKQLQHDLGLGKFNYVMIQKVMDVPMNIYIVTVDSRRPTVYLSPYKIKTTDCSKILKVRQYGLANLSKNFKLTPPMPIERTSPIVGISSVFILRDLAGDYLLDNKLYESERYNLLLQVIDYSMI